MQVELDKIQAYDEEEETKELVAQLDKDFIAAQELVRNAAELVQGEQQEKIDQIEQRAEQVNQQVVAGGKELKHGAKEQNKKYKWLFGGGLATLGGLVGLIGGPIGVTIGATVGGSLGAGAGRLIEKQSNKDVEKTNFAK